MANIMLCSSDQLLHDFVRHQLYKHRLSVKKSLDAAMSELMSGGYHLVIACIPSQSPQSKTVELDGIELCRMIRAEERLAHLPVLLLSTPKLDTKPGKALEDVAKQAGATLLIQSPCSPRILQEVVGKSLQKN